MGASSVIVRMMEFKKRLLVMVVTGLLGLTLFPTPAASAPRSGGQAITAPYEGQADGAGGCGFYDTTFGEVCNGFPYFGLSTGEIGGYTRVQSGDFGDRPLVRSNYGVAESILWIDASLAKAATGLRVTVTLQIEEALASFDGTKALDESPQRARVSVQLNFRDSAGRSTFAEVLVLDDNPLTPEPSSVSGTQTFTLDVPYAAKGRVGIDVRAVEYASMSTGDTGTARAVLNGHVSAIRLG